MRGHTRHDMLAKKTKKPLPNFSATTAAQSVSTGARLTMIVLPSNADEAEAGADALLDGEAVEAEGKEDEDDEEDTEDGVGVL